MLIGTIKLSRCRQIHLQNSLVKSLQMQESVKVFADEEKTDTLRVPNHNRVQPRFPNLFYLLLFPLKYGDIDCGVTWAERTAGAHRLVAHRCAGWVFSRVTIGRLFLRTKRAEPGDAHNVSLRSEAPLSSSAPCQHLVECNTSSSEIPDLVPRRRASSSRRKLTVSVELYDC